MRAADTHILNLRTLTAPHLSRRSGGLELRRMMTVMCWRLLIGWKRIRGRGTLVTLEKHARTCLRCVASGISAVTRYSSKGQVPNPVVVLFIGCTVYVLGCGLFSETGSMVVFLSSCRKAATRGVEKLTSFRRNWRSRRTVLVGDPHAHL